MAGTSRKALQHIILEAIHKDNGYIQWLKEAEEGEGKDTLIRELGKDKRKREWESEADISLAAYNEAYKRSVSLVSVCKIIHVLMPLQGRVRVQVPRTYKGGSGEALQEHQKIHEI